MKTWPNILSFICIAMLFLAPECKHKGKTVVQKTWYDEQKKVLYEEFEVKKENPSVKHGLYKRFDEQGTIREIAYYVNDTLEGERRLFHPNGQLKAIEHYANGEYEGLYQGFNEQGILEVEGMYKDSRMTGVWKFYYPDGRLKEEVTFSYNKEHGPYTKYYPDGTVEETGQFKWGKMDGLWKYYYEDGTLRKEVYYEDGQQDGPAQYYDRLGNPVPMENSNRD